MKKWTKLYFSETEMVLFKENKPKGMWVTEYLTAKMLQAEGVLPAHFWDWRLKRQSEWLGIRNKRGRPGPLVRGTPIQVLMLRGRATNRELAEASGVGPAQCRRRLGRDERAHWDTNLKVWEYRE